MLLDRLLPAGEPENSLRARLRFSLASTWWCMFGGSIGPFATKGEIRQVARAWASEYWRKEERARFKRRMGEGLRRYGIRNAETGIVSLPLTPEVDDFLFGDLEDPE